MRQQTKDVLKLTGLTLLLAGMLIAPTAWAQEVDQAILDWDASGGPVQWYNVYRADAGADGVCPTYPAGYVAVGRVDVPTVTYTDGPLGMGQTYCWHVTAANVDEESDASNLATKRIPYPKPAAPANLRVR